MAQAGLVGAADPMSMLGFGLDDWQVAAEIADTAKEIDSARQDALADRIGQRVAVHLARLLTGKGVR